MAQQTINIGATANDGTGDQLRTAFDKVNDNFVEVYTELGGTSLSNIKISGNTISTDDTNGNLTLDPNGTGTIILANAVTASSTVAITGATVVNGGFAAAGTSGTFITFGAADVTPTVAGGNVFKSGGAVTVTTFDDGVTGQAITVISEHAVVFDVTGTTLKGGSADITTAAGDVTSWIFDGTNWYLTNFMDVSADLSAGH
jgi:hypothetical protein